MRTCFALAMAIVLVGCKVKIDEPAVTTPAAATTSSTTGTSATTATTGATTGTPPTTASSTTGATTGTTGAATDSTAGSPKGAKVDTSLPKGNPVPDEAKPGFNRDRLNQLVDLKTTPVEINGQKLTAWVMDNDSKRNEGMMFLKDSDVKPDQAMLFVFQSASEQGFWMKHTLIPLDIAYIGSDKKVVSVATMKPLDENNVPSHGKSQYVLEMKVGTIQRLGIAKGTTVSFPASIKATE